jgi:hypothetical protein
LADQLWRLQQNSDGLNSDQNETYGEADLDKNQVIPFVRVCRIYELIIKTTHPTSFSSYWTTNSIFTFFEYAAWLYSGMSAVLSSKEDNIAKDPY